MDLITAARLGKFQQLDELIQSGADLEGRDRDGRTALHHVMETNSSNHDEKLQCLDRLIGAGADLNAQDNTKLAPLHLAVKNPDGLKKLLRSGANPNIQNIKGNTPLHIAAIGFEKGLKVLLDHRADPTIMNHESQTPEETAWMDSVKEIFRDHRITHEHEILQGEGPQNLPERPTPRIGRDR